MPAQRHGADRQQEPLHGERGGQPPPAGEVNPEPEPGPAAETRMGGGRTRRGRPQPCPEHFVRRQEAPQARAAVMARSPAENAQAVGEQRCRRHPRLTLFLGI